MKLEKYNISFFKLISRTQRNGTLLHILGVGDKFIRLYVQGKKVVLEVPETDSFTTSVFGKRANDGKWHTVKILNENSNSVELDVKFKLLGI